MSNALSALAERQWPSAASWNASTVLWISELTGLGLGVRTAARASWDEDM